MIWDEVFNIKQPIYSGVFIFTANIKRMFDLL